MDWLATAVLVATPLAAMFLWWSWQDSWLERRPQSDITRLKAHMEDAARRVIDVKPDGVIAGSRYSPAYRMYHVLVRELDGELTEHSIGVEAHLFGGYPGVRDFSHPKRTRRI